MESGQKISCSPCSASPEVDPVLYSRSTAAVGLLMHDDTRILEALQTFFKHVCGQCDQCEKRNDSVCLFTRLSRVCRTNLAGMQGKQKQLFWQRFCTAPINPEDLLSRPQGPMLLTRCSWWDSRAACVASPSGRGPKGVGQQTGKKTADVPAEAERESG